MGVIEKVLEEIDKTMECGLIDYINGDPVITKKKAKDIIRKHMNDADYPYITEKDIEAAPPASKEFLAECREVAKKYGKNDGWIPVEERLPDEKINPVSMDFYEYQVTAKFGNTKDVRHYKYGKGHWWHGAGIVDKYVVAWKENPEPYKPERRQGE